MSTTIAWLSDIHLNSYYVKKWIFLNPILESNASAVVITGDISLSERLPSDLQTIESIVKRPVYFVLGNHDFWGSNFNSTRKRVRDYVKNSEFVKYLPDIPYVKLTPQTFLIGQDCWYDCGYGDPYKTDIIMNDWNFIEEFQSMFNLARIGNPNAINLILQKCRDITAKDIKKLHNSIVNIMKLKERPKELIVMCHFPPFEECLVNKSNSKTYYSCKSFGDLLLKAAEKFSDVNFTVLCGHTHGASENQILPNLHVKVAGAEYHEPRVNSFLKFA